MAVLALVIDRPSYGYELATRFERRYATVIPVGRSAIYKALTELDTAGLVAISHVAGTKRQPKPYYRATELGERLHRAWLAEDLREDPASVELRLRLLGGPSDPEALGALVDEYEALCLTAVDALAPPPDGAPLRERMAVEWERSQLAAKAAFLKRCRAMIAAEVER